MLSLKEIAQTLACKEGDYSEAVIDSVSIDTRVLAPGALFVAIRGEHFDGHDFVVAAAMAGAIAVIVEREISGLTIPSFHVKDSIVALGQLGRYWRQQWPLRLVGVTGSAGKTSVKEMVAAILREYGQCYATHKNFNNHIGVPLCLLQMRKEDKFSVLEIGANHPGEIAYLTKIAQPDVAVITNIMPHHLEGFGDEAGVAQAKSEIWQGLFSEGCAVINADDKYATFLTAQAGNKARYFFGLANSANVTARHIQLTSESSAWDLQTPAGSIAIELTVPGEHNIRNALAASACALALDVPLTAIQSGLQRYRGVEQRLSVRRGLKKSRLLDDSYNASIGSVIAAFQVLASYPGLRLVVLGDLAELGPKAAEYHADLGYQAAQHGIDGLYTCGGFSAEASKAFGKNARHFTQQEELIRFLKTEMPEEATVLIKGSHGARMDRVVNALLEEGN